MNCYTDKLSIGELYRQKSAINEKPAYQRESAVWSPEKKRLFIDSLINGYDIPKIYFHELPDYELKKYALIDGKQRITTIWEFLEGGLNLAKDFSITNKDTKYLDIKPSMGYKDFSIDDKQIFRDTMLAIVFVKRANEDDIEELFFRLNNGEPLNAAEKRNAVSSKMNELIRELATNTFFTKKLKFQNTRYSHYEIAAKFILLEKNQYSGGSSISDLKKKYLDDMVESDSGKKISEADKNGLSKRVADNLSILNKVFQNEDILLSKQAYPPLYYIFVKQITDNYGHSHLYTIIRQFLEEFQTKRLQNLELPEEQRNNLLLDFSRLMQQGTNDRASLKTRINILTRFFLEAHPDVKILDNKRQYTEEERYVIWINGGKKCAECQKPLPDINDMEADHIQQHKHGGETTLKNARSLCIDCNQKAKKNTK